MRKHNYKMYYRKDTTTPAQKPLKPVEFYLSSGVSEYLDPLTVIRFHTLSAGAFMRSALDMYVIEKCPNGTGQVRAAGRSFADPNHLDESTVFHTFKSFSYRTIWAKIDDYGSKYVCTFLFPSEY